MFEECVQQVYNARGPKLAAKEVIRLQTALLNFSLKCFPRNIEQVNRCLDTCEIFVRQAGNVASNFSNAAAPVTTNTTELDEASVSEMERMLSIPLDTLALKVLELDHYADLLQFLPWENRRDVGISLLRALDATGDTPQAVKQVDELFTIIAPVIRDKQPTLTSQLGSVTVSPVPELIERSREMHDEDSLVSKLVHLLDSADDEVAFQMLSVARNHLSTGGPARLGSTLVPVVFSALKLAARVHAAEQQACSVVKEPELSVLASEPEATTISTTDSVETPCNTTAETKEVCPDVDSSVENELLEDEKVETNEPATDTPKPPLATSKFLR
jgi:vacuolar protein sorting-associated protein 35